MTLPLVVLAVFAVGAGWIGISSTFPVLGGLVPNALHDFLAAGMVEPTPEAAFHLVPFVASVVASLGGLFLGWLVYRRIPAGASDPLARWLGPVHTLLKRKYYFDELYQLVFVRPVYWIGKTSELPLARSHRDRWRIVCPCPRCPLGWFGAEKPDRLACDQRLRRLGWG